MIENEYKFILGKTDFFKLMSSFDKRFSLAPVSEKVQINYYYDTEALDLYKNQAALRARQAENGLKLEFKQRICDKGGCCTSYEKSWDISYISERIRLPTEEIPQLKTDIQKNIYTLLGSLVTQRKSIHIADNLIVEFDRNFYLGICDYEIEMETDKENLKAAEKLISELSLPLPLPIPATKSKFSRFIKARRDLSLELSV